MKVQTEDSNFSRDTNNKALINNNIGALHKRRIEKNRADKVAKLEDDVSKLREDVKEMMFLLKELTNR